MADLIDFSNIGKNIDTQMGQAALTGQQLGTNAATLPGKIAATNAGNAANVSNSGLQINNNQRQQAFQMESQALASNPNAQPADYQALANKYPEFAQQVNANQQQTQHNWENTRAQMSADAVSTVAGMQARLQANDVPGALELLEARAVRQENSGDTQGAASTRSFEALIKTNPEGAKQVASSILNAGSANTAEQQYANQANQARAVVAQATVPAAISQANANASLTGTQAAYAPVERAANVAQTYATTAGTNATTGVTNQSLFAPPTAIAAAEPEYTAAHSNQQLAQQSGEMANAFGQVAQNSGARGVLGATWDNAGRKWTGDTSALQKLQAEAASLVTNAEMGSMVNGNFTDQATANALKNVPQMTDGPQAWQSYFQARQKFLDAKSAWSNARGDWKRNNNGSSGAAFRDFTIQTPDGKSVLVPSGSSFTQFTKKVAPSYYTTPVAESFDPTK